MKIGLVTTWNISCGHAEFASNLVDSVTSVDKSIEFKPITATDDNAIIEEAKDVDIVHLIYGGSPGFGFIQASTACTLRSMGKKVVLSNQVTRPDVNNSPLFDACDALISTEPLPHDNRFTYIPMGIPDGWVATGEPENLVGTIGFPFSWKGIPDIARAAKNVGMGFVGILPDYPLTLGECRAVRDNIKQVNPDSELYSDWLSREDVKRILGKCAVLVFAHRPYPNVPLGVSSACRYGLAVGRPVVFNKFEMYRDLFSYADELYFVNDDTVDNLSATLQEAVKGTKKPKRLLVDMSWKACGQKFKDVYTNLLEIQETI